MTPLRSSAALGIVLSMACSSTPNPPPNTMDSGVTDAPTPQDSAPPADTAQDTSPADVSPVDARPPREPQPIYSPCINDSECMEGLTCDTETTSGVSGGICARRGCTTDSDCLLDSFGGRRAVDGYCSTDTRTNTRFCSRVCENGLDCERDGFTCQTLNSGRFNEVRVCIAICTDDSCVDGNTCDHESGRCRPVGFTPPPGRHIGETCTAPNTPMSMPANQCLSGLCSPETAPDSMMRPVPTGFNGGQCYGRCILPQGYNPGDIWPEMLLPQGNCPTGAICFINGSTARGDLGICLDECRANSDCRVNQGYYCRKSVPLSGTMPVRTRTWTNGWCTLIDCANAMTPCPTGYMCRITTSGTTRSGRCIPATMM